MKKKLWISILIVGIAIGGFYSFVKFNSPLEVGTIASSGDRQSVVVEVGNKGIGEVKIVNVLVNNDEEPLKTKVQISNVLQGFTITKDFNSPESKKYGFRDIEDTMIEAGTSPSVQYQKSDDGTATNKDKSYGVSVLHTETIHKVNIEYKYFGLTCNETISIAN